MYLLRRIVDETVRSVFDEPRDIRRHPTGAHGGNLDLRARVGGFKHDAIAEIERFVLTGVRAIKRSGRRGASATTGFCGPRCSCSDMQLQRSDTNALQAELPPCSTVGNLTGWCRAFQ
jgi:hypothetical protein